MKFYVCHDRETGQKLWRGLKNGVPEVFKFDQPRPTVLTEPWQLWIYKMNQPYMDGANWRSLMKRDRFITNMGGYWDGDQRQDYVNRFDLNARPLRMDAIRICGGSIFEGTLNGKNITVKTMDGRVLPASQPPILFRCLTVQPGGTNGEFPQCKGHPVWFPLVATGGAVTVKYKTLRKRKPYPYVVTLEEAIDRGWVHP